MFSFVLALTLGFADTSWQSSYEKATDQAMKEKKDLVIYFYEKNELDKVLANKDVAEQLQKFVCLKVPVGTKFGDKRLLDYPGLREMQGKPGLAVVSYSNRKLPTFASVISVHPVVGSRYSWVPQYGVEQVKVTLSLPAHATLSQRSMIYAVRVHPESPRSVFCICDPVFLEHAKSHSQLQAAEQKQHHANLTATSNMLHSKTGQGFSGTQEIVAESWGRFVGGENVLEAAFSCVDAWRHSPAHWGAVASNHLMYGYDIARGGNGTWYATGIFAQ